ncbi:MAG: hypothetical protein WDO13_07985 [Verrucomicrobiota bacterium]
MRHELDVVIWHDPNPSSHQNILTLRSSGVRILVIQNSDAKADLPVLTYLENWLPAYRRLAGHWQTHGVEKVLLPLQAEVLDDNRKSRCSAPS